MKPCIICKEWQNFESLYVCDRCIGDSRKIDALIDNLIENCNSDYRETLLLLNTDKKKMASKWTQKIKED